MSGQPALTWKPTSRPAGPLPVFPGPGTQIIGRAANRHVGLSYARFGPPWKTLRTGDLCPAAWHPGTPTLTDVMAEPAAPAPVVSAEITRVTDETIETVTGADRGVLILAKNDCGHCAAYQAEIKAALARGGFAELAIGKLVLNEPGATDYKRGNRWLADVKDLPFTVLYRNGQIVDRFLGSRAAYLEERVRAAFGDEPELAAAA